ncbi:MAG: trigger factor [Betaproteobacteria bacterium]|nr:trigger factor [Betaproteobacteria bacterium]
MSSVETLGALERRLNAFIPQQQLRGEIEARLKRLGRTAKVHGFRPGKVPFKILQQQYGAQVHQEVLGDALQRSFTEAVQANSLKVAGYPDFEIKAADPAAEQIEYSATFEVYPEVVLGDIGAESMERATYVLSDADVDNTINTLRKQRAVYEPTDRAAQNEDRVRIDFSGKLDGKVFEGGEAKDFAVVLGAGRMLQDFENAIIGMKAGETKSFDMTFPKDYHGKNVAGKQVTFTITLHGVEAPRLPELDAEFAKLLGVEDGDVTKLKAEIRDNLAREVERRLKAHNKNSAMDLLLKVVRLEAPKALVDSEVQNLMQQSMHDMRERGIKIPQGASLPPELFTERAQRRVKLGLILVELVKQQDLNAKPEQVKALVQDYAQSFEHPEEVVKWHYGDSSRLQEAKNMVLEDNVVAWVMKVAKVTDRVMEFNELMGKD